MGRVRHSRLLMSDRQPLRPAPALLAREPSPDLLEQHVLAVPLRQRRLVQEDAPVAVPAEGRQGEGVVVWSRNSCGLPKVELQESPEAFAASHRPILRTLLQRKEEEIVLSLVIALGVEVLDIRAQCGP